MVSQSKGKIFLAEERGVFENSRERRFSTFNFADFFDENKAAFGPIFLLNDETIAANNSIQVRAECSSFQIFLPLRGELEFRNAAGRASVDVEELLVVESAENESLTILNSYKADWISFIQIGIQAEPGSGLLEKLAFNFSSQNGLVKIISNEAQIYPFTLSLGLFDGRQEALYKLSDIENKVLCFVVSGAFEIEGRLLHERDSLALWDLSEVDIEALSNHAILLLIELK